MNRKIESSQSQNAQVAGAGPVNESEEEELTGPWSEDPFKSCPVVIAHAVSRSRAEVYARSVSDDGKDEYTGPRVEPDSLRAKEADLPSTRGVQGATMWMRIQAAQQAAEAGPK